MIRPVVLAVWLMGCGGPGPHVDPDADVTIEDGWTTARVGNGKFAPDPVLAVTASGELWAASTSIMWSGLGSDCGWGGLTSASVSVVHLDGTSAMAVSTTGIAHHGDPSASFDLALDPKGKPWLALAHGQAFDPIGYCGPNDLAVKGPDGDIEIVVSTSAEALSGDAELDAGSVVGLWPSITFDSDGYWFVAYQDRHDGRPDHSRGDLEMASEKTVSQVAPLEGLGRQNTLRFDGEGRRVLATWDEPMTGPATLYVLRESGTGWDRVSVASGDPVDRPDVEVMDDGGMVVAWVDAVGTANVMRSVGDDRSRWHTYSPLRDSDVGVVDIAVEETQDGKLVIAWSDAEVVTVALEGADGDWSYEEVPFGRPCAEQLDLALARGRTHILAYCPGDDMVYGDSQLFHGWRSE